MQAGCTTSADVDTTNTCQRMGRGLNYTFPSLYRRLGICIIMKIYEAQIALIEYTVSGMTLLSLTKAQHRTENVMQCISRFDISASGPV